MSLNSPQAQEEASLASRQGHTPSSLRASPDWASLGFSLLLMWLLLLTRRPAAPWTHSLPPPPTFRLLIQVTAQLSLLPTQSGAILSPPPPTPPSPAFPSHQTAPSPVCVREATLSQAGRTCPGQPRPLPSRPGHGKSLILGPLFTTIHMAQGSAGHPRLGSSPPLS